MNMYVCIFVLLFCTTVIFANVDVLQFADSTYEIKTEPQKWKDANKTCNSNNGTLIIISSLNESDYLTGIVDSKETYWIGLKRECKRKKCDWKWTDGTNLIWNKPPWAPRYPKLSRNNLNRNYVSISNGQWKNEFKRDEYKYICEYAHPCSNAPELCKNGGSCIATGARSYACVCANGTTGVDCGDLVSVCEPNPCDNNASCIAEGDSYWCNCSINFTGNYLYCLSLRFYVLI